jgi:hypothetical protein
MNNDKSAYKTIILNRDTIQPLINTLVFEMYIGLNIGLNIYLL